MLGENQTSAAQPFTHILNYSFLLYTSFPTEDSSDLNIAEQKRQSFLKGDDSLAGVVGGGIGEGEGEENREIGGVEPSNTGI